MKFIKKIKNKIRRFYNHYLTTFFPLKQLGRIVGSASKAKGTTNTEERLFLYRMMINHHKLGVALEIGSYRGASTAVIAQGLIDSKRNPETSVFLYCIDTWNNDAMSEGQQDTFESFQETTDPWKDIIKTIQGNSHHVAVPENSTFDLVFIDADHSYEACRKDADKFAPYVRDGGCLIFDDHISFSGVTRVVGELLAGGHWYVIDSCKNTIALRRDEQSVENDRRTERPRLDIIPPSR
ncbi:MAG: class I SAM-dependent methyltransferase [Candidatus Paceibacterota bacterium]